MWILWVNILDFRKGFEAESRVKCSEFSFLVQSFKKILVLESIAVREKIRNYES